MERCRRTDASKSSLLLRLVILVVFTCSTVSSSSSSSLHQRFSSLQQSTTIFRNAFFTLQDSRLLSDHYSSSTLNKLVSDIPRGGASGSSKASSILDDASVSVSKPKNKKVVVEVEVDGASDDDDDDDDEYNEYADDEDDDEEYQDAASEEKEDDDDDDELVEPMEEEILEEVAESDDAAVKQTKKSRKKTAVSYDKPLAPSPMLNMYVTIGLMLIGRKVDLLSPIVVKFARAAFIIYLVSLQIFLIYVRNQAKLGNDQTTITINNPISSLLQSQLGDGNNMVKNLASSFLSSKLTVVDYDLKQATSMQSGLIMNMLFMWFLHFKMKQVQPLLMQTFTGFANLIYSPLFQVYILGRNLERPFKNPNLINKQEQIKESSSNEQPKVEVTEEMVQSDNDDDDDDTTIHSKTTVRSSDSNDSFQTAVEELDSNDDDADSDDEYEVEDEYNDDEE